MKIVLTTIFLLGLINCGGEECVDCFPSDTTKSTDPFRINAVEVVDKMLKVEVSYAGGCENHDFEVVWPEVITMIYPPDFGVTLYHENNGDSCEAYITEELQFDISKSGLGLSDEAIADMRITVINGSNPDEKVSNR